MGIVIHIQPWRSSFDAAQQQMADGVEADSTQLQSVFDGTSYFRNSEGLDQAQHLHILAASVLVEPGFEQTPQLRKGLWQLPGCKRRCLIQRPRLLFEKGEVV